MQILHKTLVPPVCRGVAQTAQPLQSRRRQRVAVPPRRRGTDTANVGVMKAYAHDIVQRLLELRALEERLVEFRRSREQTIDVTALIESLRANIPLTELLVHDRMRDKGKHSVAEVRRGVCSACHLALALGNVAALRRGELHRCGNCGRYLYLEEEEEQGASPAPAPKRKTTKGKSSATSDAN